LTIILARDPGKARIGGLQAEQPRQLIDERMSRRRVRVISDLLFEPSDWAGPVLTGILAGYPISSTSSILILQPRLGGRAGAALGSGLDLHQYVAEISINSLTRQKNERGMMLSAPRGISMTTNVGTIDRIIRVLIGLVLIAYALNYIYSDTGRNWVGWIGVVPILTAIFATCPGYSLIGLSTSSVDK
jgi:hypothetical protein